MGVTVVNPDNSFVATEEDDSVTFNNNHNGASRIDALGGVDTLIVDHRTQGRSIIEAAQLSGGSFNGTAKTSSGYTTTFFSNFEILDFTGSNVDDRHLLRLQDFALERSIKFDGWDGIDLLTLAFGATSGDWTFDASGATIFSSVGSFSNYEQFRLYGGSGNDSITSGDLDDELRGGGGTNILKAGAGDDTVRSESTTDYADGGSGTDYWEAVFGAPAFGTQVAIGLEVFVDGALAATNFESYRVTTGIGDDTITVSTTNAVAARGGRGMDTIVAQYSDDTDAIYFRAYITHTGSISGSVGETGANYWLAFDEMEEVAFLGGSGDDFFKLEYGMTGDAISMIDGGAGNDHLEFDLRGLSGDTRFIVNADGFVDSNRGSFSQIETFRFEMGDGDDLVATGDGADYVDGNGGADDISGGNGDDVLFGGAQSDILRGGAGNDSLTGTTGYVETDDANQLFGDEGDDVLYAGLGNDLLDGGEGRDTVDYTYFRVGVSVSLAEPNALQEVATDVFHRLTDIEHLRGSHASDNLTGSGAANVIEGRYGNDRIFGLYGADRLFGGDGNDELIGGIGYDWLEGGDGADRLFGNNGNDTMLGGVGNDLIRGNYGHDTIDGGDGDDDIDGGVGMDTIDGGLGNDTINGGTGIDTIYGGDGDDIITGAAGDDTIDGGNGYDRIDGGVGMDTIRGGEGRDTISGAGGDDYIDGGSWADVLFGDAGADLLYGGTGNDSLDGGSGADDLFGEGGNDTLTGGFGVDTLTGGTGGDTFVFASLGHSSSSAGAADTITDFSKAQGDIIDLSAIDANANVGGNQGFAFVGQAAFSGTAGELRYEYDGGGDTLLLLDVDGDGSSDMTVRLTGEIALTGAQFGGLAAADLPDAKSAGDMAPALVGGFEAHTIGGADFFY
ncbi:calcium-binding protein [Qipengyuania sp. 902]|uniref:calcium-binding protein n=1 Tax=Qipengyuania sp. 902 TaxID=3417565 RepID=UPI003EBC0876